ncbi:MULTISPECIES: helix-turn-helix domain-containing protein [Shewanella]|uniref:Helix-turn-helix transcriptional regulator n=1 Tax=Shewanella scandinavica TaxID=3063538 RepID=A0ABU3FYN7_9GAMM|nr:MULTISPECIES: helix-turn-helix transcriptional regulator [Shewanella]MCS6237983.1 helix-turn-helix transcriptional regulator [Shewanella baltica]MDT3280485.1 helix-turn-helix transcriptional regulator [Shewanella sp. SP2S1-2]
MQPSDLLDLIRAVYGLTSDYQVMKRFGFSQTGISNWRTNRSFPDDNVLIKFADALDIHLGVLLLHSVIWRQKDPAAKAALQKILDALAYCEGADL